MFLSVSSATRKLSASPRFFATPIPQGLQSWGQTGDMGKIDMLLLSDWNAPPASQSKFELCKSLKRKVCGSRTCKPNSVRRIAPA